MYTSNEAQNLFQEGLFTHQHGQPDQADSLFQRTYTLNPENIDVIYIILRHIWITLKSLKMHFFME